MHDLTLQPVQLLNLFILLPHSLLQCTIQLLARLLILLPKSVLNVLLLDLRRLCYRQLLLQCPNLLPLIILQYLRDSPLLRLPHLDQLALLLGHDYGLLSVDLSILDLQLHHPDEMLDLEYLLPERVLLVKFRLMPAREVQVLPVNLRQDLPLPLKGVRELPLQSHVLSL